jgi:hypothetical protein
MCWKFLIRNGLYVVIWAVDASRLEMKTDKGLRHIGLTGFYFDGLLLREWDSPGFFFDEFTGFFYHLLFCLVKTEKLETILAIAL